MLIDSIRRTTGGLYLGQTLRIRTETKFMHPATITYIHPSGLWVMLDIQNANGTNYRECFSVHELLCRGVIKPQTYSI